MLYLCCFFPFYWIGWPVHYKIDRQANRPLSDLLLKRSVRSARPVCSPAGPAVRPASKPFRTSSTFQLSTQTGASTGSRIGVCGPCRSRLDLAVAAWTSRALSPEGQFGGELLQQRQARILRNRNRDKVYLDAIGYKGSHSYCNVTRQKLCQCCRLRRVQAPKSWLCWWIAQFILERRSRCRVKLFAWIGMKLV